MERGGGRELEHEPLARRARSAAPPSSTEAVGIERSRRPPGRIACFQAAWICSRSSGGPSLGAGLGGRRGALGGRGRAAPARAGGARRALVARRGSARLELLEAVGGRLAREVGARPRHLDERELERQARVAALADVVDGDGEQVDEPQHLGLAELVRLGAQPLARLRGHGERVGHLAHVLDEQQVAQVLEQVGDEPRQVLALLGELLDEREQAGGVAVDDQVAEAEERLLLDGAEQLRARPGTVTSPSVAAASWSSVETASRKLPRALRAISESAASGASISSPSATRRSSFVSSARRGRAKRNVWQRERTVGEHLARGRSCRR